jgi:guanylate kinase
MKTSGTGKRRVFVVSAPSGGGKRTVLSHVMRTDSDLEMAVSCTTRPPRDGENHGLDYYFLDRAEFQAKADAGEFAEWAEVHGNLYGTLREELERRMASGKDVVLEVDVQGMRQMKASGLDPVTVFITVPSLEVLRERIASRGQNDPADTALRMKNAEEEMAAQDEFDAVIVNDNLDQAVAAFHALVREARGAAT